MFWQPPIGQGTCVRSHDRAVSRSVPAILKPPCRHHLLSPPNPIGNQTTTAQDGDSYRHKQNKCHTCGLKKKKTLLKLKMFLWSTVNVLRGVLYIILQVNRPFFIYSMTHFVIWKYNKLKIHIIWYERFFFSLYPFKMYLKYAYWEFSFKLIPRGFFP